MPPDEQQPVDQGEHLVRIRALVGRQQHRQRPGALHRRDIRPAHARIGKSRHAAQLAASIGVAPMTPFRDRTCDLRLLIAAQTP